MFAGRRDEAGHVAYCHSHACTSSALRPPRGPSHQRFMHTWLWCCHVFRSLAQRYFGNVPPGRLCRMVQRASAEIFFFFGSSTLAEAWEGQQPPSVHLSTLALAYKCSGQLPPAPVTIIHTVRWLLLRDLSGPRSILTHTGDDYSTYTACFGRNEQSPGVLLQPTIPRGNFTGRLPAPKKHALRHHPRPSPHQADVRVHHQICQLLLVQVVALRLRCKPQQLQAHGRTTQSQTRPAHALLADSEAWQQVSQDTPSGVP